MSIRMPAGAVAAPMAYAQPSYAAPMTYAAPQGVQMAMPPQQGQLASANMPDPNAIEQQKRAYATNLNEQLQQGTQVIMQEAQAKKKMVNDAAAQQKAMFILQVDQELKKQEMLSDQEMNTKILELERAAHEQRLALETQAANLTMEYNQARAQEAFAMQNNQILKVHEDAQAQINHLASKLQPVVAPGVQQVQAPVTYAAPATYAAPPTMMAAPQGRPMPAQGFYR